MKNRLYLGVLLTFMLVALWSCKQFQGATVTATPDPLVVIADSIKYEVKGVVPPKSGFKKKGTYTAQGKIGSRSQGKVTISSTKYPDIKKTGMDTTLKYVFPFFDDMDGNDLMMEQKYERKSKTFELPDIRDLAQCCITTSRLVWENDQFIFVSHEHSWKQKVPLRLDAKFDFPKDIWEIQEGQYSKGDIVAIGQFLKAKKVATKITIVGFASPEGPYKRNVELSVNRSKQVQDWLVEQLKAEGYNQYLDSTFFNISTTSADWEGFKAGLSSSGYPADVKSQIIEIVSAGLSEDQKEKQIMALVGGKDKVESILAPLRRATIVVEGFEPRKTDREIDQLIQDFVDGKLQGNIAEIFEQEEWLYAISRVDDLKKKKVLLEAFRNKYPSDYRAFNDLGAIALWEGDTEAGLEYLEAAQKLKTNDHAINNNLGVAYKNKGQYVNARSVLESSYATKSTKEASFNLGVVLEKQGMFNDGVTRFNSSNPTQGSYYNSGLCKLMMDDLPGAQASLDESIKLNKDESAWPYYLRAVVAARQKDAATMAQNLRKACMLDAELKKKAPKDLEFRDYFTSPEFKASIQ